MSDVHNWPSGAKLISGTRLGFEASAVLAVAIESGKAHQAFLFRDDNNSLVLQGYAAADPAQNLACRPDREFGCNLSMISIVRKVLQSDKAYQGRSETGDDDIVCVPVPAKRAEKAALYIRSKASEDVLSDADRRAFELFGITLGRVIDLGHVNSGERKIAGHDENATVLDEPVSVAKPRFVDPSDLAEVAKSIAIEINNSLTAIVAHTSAALRWINKGEPDIPRAKHSLDRIAAAAFSAEGIIAVYKSTGQGKRPEVELVDIRQAVICALDELEHEFLEFDISSECSLLGEEFVFAEPKQLHQTLVNIISAALDSLKGSDSRKNLKILGEHHHHEFVIKVSDDAGPLVCNRDDAGPDTAHYTSRDIKLAIANTLAHVQGGGLALSGFEENEKSIKLRLPKTKRERYLHFS